MLGCKRNSLNSEKKEEYKIQTHGQIQRKFTTAYYFIIT